MGSPYKQAALDITLPTDTTVPPQRTTPPGTPARTVRTLDLFAGAGGLSLGFRQSNLGYEPVFAIENEPAAARTFARNFDCPVYDGSIEDVEEFAAADVIIGGPPCQGFSPLGKNRDDDSRSVLNELWQHYLRAVHQVKPVAFIIENVPEFQRSAQFMRLLELMETDPLLSEYAYNYGVLNAADYGAPQRRKRGIFMAVRGIDEVPWPPERTHGPHSTTEQPYVTVRDAFEGLDLETTGIEVTTDDDGNQNLHFGRTARPMSLERYRAIPEGGNRFDLARNRPDLLPRCWAEKPTGTADVMGRLWWDKPGLTVRTEFFKPEKGRYLHPVADRPISHREAARLQTFPDDFVFEGTKIQIARQIGNAVPAALAEALAWHLHPLIVGRLK